MQPRRPTAGTPVPDAAGAAVSERRIVVLP